VLSSDGFNLWIFFQAVQSHFPADPRLLVATEGRKGIELASVHIHLAGPHPPRNTHGSFRITGPDGARESVDGVVGDADDFFVGIVGEHREHGPKISSCAIVILDFTSAKMVGST